MKKNYLQPAIKVMTVHHEIPLLTGSPKVYDTEVKNIEDLLVSP